MSMKKKALMAASYVMVAALAVGGTVAYLTDTDNDHNTMTLGNVKIEQHEYERAVNEDGTFKKDTIDNRESYVLTDFTQDKPLVPVAVNPGTGEDGSSYDATTVRMSQVDSYGGMDVFEASNAQDKFVTVENTGKNSAYVRTLVAVEAGETDGTLVWRSARATSDAEAAGESDPWLSNSIGKVTINDNTYVLTEYIYKGAKRSDGYVHKDGVLPAGETTYPSVCQFYLRAAATNEDVEAIDGNDNDKLDILVLSQAVQADGFDDAETALNKAFGKVSDADEETLNEWFAEEETTEDTTVEATENA